MGAAPRLQQQRPVGAATRPVDSCVCPLGGLSLQLHVLPCSLVLAGAQVFGRLDAMRHASLGVGEPVCRAEQVCCSLNRTSGSPRTKGETETIPCTAGRLLRCQAACATIERHSPSACTFAQKRLRVWGFAVTSAIFCFFAPTCGFE